MSHIPDLSLNLKRLLLIGLLTAMASSTVYAEMREGDVCPDVIAKLNIPMPMVPPAVCYSGFSCDIGMRGDWLDITNEVVFTPVRHGRSNVSAGGAVHSRGTESNGGLCVPRAGRDREGYILVRATHIAGEGRMRVTARRPGPLGASVHSDHYDFDVRDGSHYLEPFPQRGLAMRVGQTKVFEIAGEGVEDIRVKPQPLALAYTTASAARAPRTLAAAATLRAPANAQILQRTVQLQRSNNVTVPSGDAATPPAVAQEIVLLGKTRIMVRVQAKFDRPGIFSLGDYLEFAGGEPPINRDIGWPLIDVQP